jgi:hypothetical protein
MILLPRWRWTARIMRSPYASTVPALLYAVLVAPRLGAIWPALSRPTLDGIAALLGSPAGATIAWAHFLAFDLFVGRWIYLDARERQISTWFMSPTLFFTLVLGPLGFLLYLAIRSARTSSSPRTRTTSAFNGEDAKQGLLAGLPEARKRAGSELRSLVYAALEINRPITILGGAMLLVLVATVVGVFVDPALSPERPRG